MQLLSPENYHVRALTHRAKDVALWEMLVERSASPDIYFRPGYLRLSETIGGGEAIALLCDWRGQCIALRGCRAGGGNECMDFLRKPCSAGGTSRNPQLCTPRGPNTASLLILLKWSDRNS